MLLNLLSCFPAVSGELAGVTSWMAEWLAGSEMVWGRLVGEKEVSGACGFPIIRSSIRHFSIFTTFCSTFEALPKDAVRMLIMVRPQIHT